MNLTLIAACNDGKSKSKGGLNKSEIIQALVSEYKIDPESLNKLTRAQLQEKCKELLRRSQSSGQAVQPIAQRPRPRIVVRRQAQRSSSQTRLERHEIRHKNDDDQRREETQRILARLREERSRQEAERQRKAKERQEVDRKRERQEAERQRKVKERQEAERRRAQENTASTLDSQDPVTCPHTPEKVDKMRSRSEMRGKMSSLIDKSSAKFGKVLGSGVYGEVLQIKDQDAVVKVSQSQANYDHSVLRETSVLLTLQGQPNVANILDYDGTDKVYLKKYDRSLDDLRKTSGPLSSDEIRKIMHGLVNGLNIMNNRNLLHRDLKHANVLMDRHNNPYIADFGLSRFWNNSKDVSIKKNFMGPTAAYLTDVVVTLWWRAPEVALVQGYDIKSDLWSLGVMFAELFMPGNKYLFSGQYTDDELIKQQMKYFGPIKGTSLTADGWLATANPTRENLPLTIKPSDDASDLMLSLLTIDPKKRIGFKEILAHPYFKGMPFTEPAMSLVERLRMTDVLCLTNRICISGDARRNLVGRWRKMCDNKDGTFTSREYFLGLMYIDIALGKRTSVGNLGGLLNSTMILTAFVSLGYRDDEIGGRAIRQNLTELNRLYLDDLGGYLIHTTEYDYLLAHGGEMSKFELDKASLILKDMSEMEWYRQYNLEEMAKRVIQFMKSGEPGSDSLGRHIIETVRGSRA